MMHPRRTHVDVLIVGLGVTGAAIAWVLSLFTNVRKILAIEKNPRAAMVNSNPWNNAQTSHDGGTETNYSLSHALKVLKAALMLRAYVRSRHDKPGLFQVTNRMVLGVGREEVAKLRARYKEFRNAYPDLRLVEAAELQQIEPKVMEGRNPLQPVIALVSKEGYAINYQLLAECMIEDAQTANPAFRTRFNTKVERVERGADGLYHVYTNSGTFTTRVIVFAAGAYSLLHAQRLGYGLNLGILSVAGSFFSAGPVVNGKVYRPQIEGRPFAELHIDHDIVTQGSRIGPTTKPILLMERYHLETFWDYITLPIFSLRGAFIALRILIKNGLLGYVFMNALYDIPVIGKYLFLKKAQETIPSLRYRDLTRRKNAGGVRPQIVDMETGEMVMGERTIFGKNTIASTTPSPGASVSIYNAVETFVPKIVEMLGGGFWFNRSAFEQHLGLNRDPRYTANHPTSPIAASM